MAIGIWVAHSLRAGGIDGRSWSWSYGRQWQWQWRGGLGCRCGCGEIATSARECLLHVVLAINGAQLLQRLAFVGRFQAVNCVIIAFHGPAIDHAIWHILIQSQILELYISRGIGSGLC